MEAEQINQALDRGDADHLIHSAVLAMLRVGRYDLATALRDQGEPRALLAALKVLRLRLVAVAEQPTKPVTG